MAFKDIVSIKISYTTKYIKCRSGFKKKRLVSNDSMSNSAGDGGYQ